MGQSPGNHQFGPFTLLEKLALSGPASRYRAELRRGKSASRPLTLDVVPLEQITGGARAFLARADAAKALRHASLLRVLDFGEIDGQCYVASEPSDGLSLARLVATCAHHNIPFPVDVALQLMLQASQGVAAIHKAQGSQGDRLGLTHGGLSPYTLWVRRDGRLKVGDLWLAGLKGQPTPGGASLYQAPEALGGAASAAADIYSLGRVLSELLGPSPAPASVLEALEKSTCEDPEARYSSASRLAQALAAGLGELSQMTALAPWLEPVFAAFSAAPPPRKMAQTVQLPSAGTATVELPAQQSPPTDERTATVAASTLDALAKAADSGPALPFHVDGFGDDERSGTVTGSPHRHRDHAPGAHIADEPADGTVARLPDHLDAGQDEDGTVARPPDHLRFADGTVARLPDHVDTLGDHTRVGTPDHVSLSNDPEASEGEERTAASTFPVGELEDETAPVSTPPPQEDATAALAHQTEQLGPATEEPELQTVQVPIPQTTPAPATEDGDDADLMGDTVQVEIPVVAPATSLHQGAQAPSPPEPEPAAPADPSQPNYGFGTLWDDEEYDSFDDADPAPAEDLGVPMMSVDQWQDETYDPAAQTDEGEADGPHGTDFIPPAPPPPPPEYNPINYTTVGLVAMGTVALGLFLALLTWAANPDGDDWLDDADDAADEGDIDKALRLYNRALAGNDLDLDDRLDAHRSMLAIATARKTWAEAARHAEYVATTDEASVDDRLAYARLLDKSMNWVTAIPVWDGLAKDPDASVSVRFEATEILSDRGAYMEAHSALDAMRGGKDGHRALLGLIELALRRGDVDHARALIAEAKGRNTDPDLLAAEGEVAMQQGELSVASERYDAALRVEPTHAGALMGQAKVAARRGQRDAATAALMQAEDTGGHRVSVALGLLLAEDAKRRGVDDVDQALVACTRARDMAGETPWVMDCEAMALMVQGDAERSHQLLEKARKAGAGIPDIWRHRALYDLSQGDPISALGILRQARQRFPNRADLRVLEARVLISRDDLAGATTLLNSVLETAPEHPEAKVEMAAIRAAQGRWSQAKALLAEVIDKQPRHLDARYALADAHLATSDGLAAQRAYEAIIAQDSAQAFAWVRIGAIHAVQGHSGEALAALERAIELGYSRERLRDDPAFFSLTGDSGWRRLMGG